MVMGRWEMGLDRRGIQMESWKERPGPEPDKAVDIIESEPLIRGWRAPTLPAPARKKRRRRGRRSVMRIGRRSRKVTSVTMRKGWCGWVAA